MNISEKIVKILSDACIECGISDPAVVLEHPTDMSHGDYASNCAMRYAREMNSAPFDLAHRIVSHMLQDDFIESVSVAAPGFINITLSKAFFTASIQNIREQGKDFGTTDQFQGQTWLLEHTSPNPNKAMHIGHLRNNLFGMAMANIAEANGAKVIRDYVDNNRGIAIAKLMWGYLKFARKDGSCITDISYWDYHRDEWKTPESEEVSADRFVDKLYVEGNTDFESSKEVEGRVRKMVVDWEAGDPLVWKLWEFVLLYSKEGREKTLARLKSKTDHVWHEHEHYMLGKDLVQEGVSKGIFKVLPDGAILTNLESYGFTDTIVQKSDGTSLYITQDLALTKKKKETFAPDKMLWVVGPDQSLAMQQVFAVCDQLGIMKFEDCTYLGYGWVMIKGVGKMSSRKGTTIYIDDVIDATKEQISSFLDTKGIELSHDLQEEIALAALKYAFLRVSRMQKIDYDVESASALEGDSGPYVQYSCVRARAIIQGAKGVFHAMSVAYDASEKTELERLLYRFPEMVTLAGRGYTPNTLVTYCTEVASAFNLYYNNYTVIDKDHKDRSCWRLCVVEATATVLENCLALLGISVPERM